MKTKKKKLIVVRPSPNSKGIYKKFAMKYKGERRYKALASLRYRTLVKPVLDGELNMNQLHKIYGISRTTISTYIDIYNENENYLDLARNQTPAGRPPIPSAVRKVIKALKNKRPNWGYKKIINDVKVIEVMEEYGVEKISRSAIDLIIKE